MKKSYSLSELSQLSVTSEEPDVGGLSTLRRAKSGDNLRNSIRAGALLAAQAAASHATRAPLLSERELRDHFNMPLNEVAKKYGMCTTALKKLCRKYGVMQWPHRKLKSLEKRIASLRAEQRYTTDGNGHIDEEIRRLEGQREGLIKGDSMSDGMPSPSRSVSPSGRSPGSTPGDGDVLFGQDEDDGGAEEHVRSALDSDRGHHWGAPPRAKVVDELDRERLQQHILTLEEENVSLRALSRSLLRERQELVSKSASRVDEAATLKRMCEDLKAQLLMLTRGPLVENKMLSTMAGPMGGGPHCAVPIKAQPIELAGGLSSPVIFADRQPPPIWPARPGLEDSAELNSLSWMGGQISPAMRARCREGSLSPGLGVEDPGGGGGDGDAGMGRGGDAGELNAISWMGGEFDPNI